MLAVEPDLEPDLAVDPHQLGLVVLAVGIVEPDLQATPVGERVQFAVDVGDEPLEHVEHLMEERSLHGPKR